jgi:hypothetical protein
MSDSPHHPPLPIEEIRRRMEVNKEVCRRLAEQVGLLIREAEERKRRTERGERG